MANIRDRKETIKCLSRSGSEKPFKSFLAPIVALLGGFQIPFPRLGVILRNAEPPGVEKAKEILGVGEALLGRFETPFPRLHVIPAAIVEKAKVVLGLGDPLLGCFQIPFPRLNVILRNAVAVLVENAKVVLGPGVALLGLQVKFGYDRGVGWFLRGMEKYARSQEEKG